MVWNSFALNLTCKYLKNNCISLNHFYVKPCHIHCTLIGSCREKDATKECAVVIAKRFLKEQLPLFLWQGFFKL